MHKTRAHELRHVIILFDKYRFPQLTGVFVAVRENPRALDRLLVILTVSIRDSKFNLGCSVFQFTDLFIM